MSVKAMSWVWEHSRSGGSARLVLLAIADCADDKGANAWPSLTTIAEKARVSRSTAIRSVAELIELGELRRVHGAGRRGRGGVSNGYSVVFVDYKNVAARDAGSGRTVTPAFPPKQSQDGTSSDLELVASASGSGVTGDTRTTKNRPKTKPRRSAPADLERFGEFWNLYPNKVGHGAAKNAWVKALGKSDADTIIDGTRTYAARQKRRLAPGEFRPATAHPSTWLNQERWMDTYEDSPEEATGPNEVYR